jgi:hypothetical protein
MSDIYRWLQEQTPSKYNMISFDKLDKQTQNILTNTSLIYPILKDGSLWQQWHKLCVACCLYIYKNNQGITTCKYTFGS